MPGETTKSRDLVVPNRHGIHARVATMLAKKVMEFRSVVSFAKGRTIADGRSVLDLLSLGAGFGEKLSLKVTGDDADGCLQAIVTLFDKHFDEVAE